MNRVLAYNEKNGSLSFSVCLSVYLSNCLPICYYHSFYQPLTWQSLIEKCEINTQAYLTNTLAIPK